MHSNATHRSAEPRVSRVLAASHPCSTPSHRIKITCAATGKRQNQRTRKRTAELNRATMKSIDAHEANGIEPGLDFHGVHHVGLLCENLETSLAFYKNIIGLEINPDRPHDKLPYRGAWLWIGTEMIHLMELPDPDPKHGRPEHGGRDRHFCVGIENLDPLIERLEDAGVKFTKSVSGRRAVFFRDPDMNCLEVFESKEWR